MTCVPLYTLFLVGFTANGVAALTQLVDDHFVGGGGEDGESGGGGGGGGLAKLAETRQDPRVQELHARFAGGGAPQGTIGDPAADEDEDDGLAPLSPIGFSLAQLATTAVPPAAP